MLGKTFSSRGLAALGGLRATTSSALLAMLVRKELLYLDTDPRSPERGQYGFLQALVQRVAYETLSRRDRKAKHLAAAAYLTAECGDRLRRDRRDRRRAPPRRPPAEPDDPDADEIKGEAREWLRRAGERAAALAATDDAQRAFEAAAGLADDPLERAWLLERAGDRAFDSDEMELALERLEAARSVFEHEGQTHAAARATGRMSLALWNLGRSDEAAEHIERAIVARTARGTERSGFPSWLFAGRILARKACLSSAVGLVPRVPSEGKSISIDTCRGARDTTPKCRSHHCPRLRAQLERLKGRARRPRPRVRCPRAAIIKVVVGAEGGVEQVALESDLEGLPQQGAPFVRMVGHRQCLGVERLERGSTGCSFASAMSSARSTRSRATSRFPVNQCDPGRLGSHAREVLVVLVLCHDRERALDVVRRLLRAAEVPERETHRPVARAAACVWPSCSKTDRACIEPLERQLHLIRVECELAGALEERAFLGLFIRELDRLVEGAPRIDGRGEAAARSPALTSHSRARARISPRPRLGIGAAASRSAPRYLGTRPIDARILGEVVGGGEVERSPVVPERVS